MASGDSLPNEQANTVNQHRGRQPQEGGDEKQNQAQQDQLVDS